jgi:hypothetical protein
VVVRHQSPAEPPQGGAVLVVEVLHQLDVRISHATSSLGERAADRAGSVWTFGLYAATNRSRNSSIRQTGA